MLNYIADPPSALRKACRHHMTSYSLKDYTVLPRFHLPQDLGHLVLSKQNILFSAVKEQNAKIGPIFGIHIFGFARHNTEYMGF